MSFTERWYQPEAVHRIQEKFKSRLKKIMLVLFMGLGKTHIACYMVRMAVNNRKKVLFIAHRFELIDQAANKFISEGMEVGIIMDGFEEERYKPIQVASIQTLNNRDLPLADLVIIDEAHRSVSPQYMKILRQYEAAGAYFVGLTATPFRTKKSEGFRVFWDSHVRPITVAQAIEEGYVCQSRVYACARIVMPEKAKGSDGDYKEEELMKAFDVDEVYINLVNKYKLHIGKDKAIVFCVNVKHSKKTCQVLIEAGIKAVHVDGNTPKDQRIQIVEDYKNGYYDAIVNVDIFTEGFDCPDIMAVVLCIATTSKAKYFQTAGRGSRILRDGSKQFYKILDMADNTKRFGFVEEDFEVDLDAQKKKPRKQGVAPIKDCPSCGYMMPVTIKVCPECKKEVPTKTTTKTVKEEAFIEMDRKKIAVKPYLGLPKKQWHEIPSELLPTFAKESNFPNATNWVKVQLALRGEGKKQVKIKNFPNPKSPEYYKWKNWLQKAYYNDIPIDAATWGSPVETDAELIFEYRPAAKQESLSINT